MGTNNGNGYNGRFTAREMAAALTKSDGFVSHAARSLACHPRTVRRYIKRYPTVAQAQFEAKELLKDDAENALRKHINQGHVTALIFFLKTKAKDRGYVERQEIKDVTEEQPARVTDEQILEEAKEIINFREANASQAD